MPRKLWPYGEAEKILRTFPSADDIVLETGYGPSGAPHIGTFAEVARTSWVGSALKEKSGKSWTLIAFSDDMDGLRKVPLNMPREKLEPHLGKPLSHVPDPFGCHPSYAAHNNARLCEMLDRFGFSYSFESSHAQYTSGGFNEGLRLIMANYDRVREIILPTIRAEKRQTWSPFLPICESCGRINGTVVTGYDAKALTVRYRCAGDRAGALGDEIPDGSEEGSGSGSSGCGHEAESSILDGRAKVGWKVDWALRWYTLRVHYEMYGKDLIESAALSAAICKVISGKRGPVQSFYEMFLDEEGRKISKSVGKGLTVDSWLSYAPEESLLLFILKDPRKAKRLSWDVVLRTTDEYLQLLQRHHENPPQMEGRSEIEMIHSSLDPEYRYEYPVSYSMLIGLIGAIGRSTPEVVKQFVHRYKGAMPGSDARLESLIHLASAYVNDRVLPGRTRRELSKAEAGLVEQFAVYLEQDGTAHEPEEIQSRAFDIAKQAEIEPKEFFRLIYNVLTGADSGPRLGSFVGLLGQKKVASIFRDALAS